MYDNRNYPLIGWRNDLISKVLASGIADKCAIHQVSRQRFVQSVVRSLVDFPGHCAQRVAHVGSRKQSLIAWHLLLA